MRPNTPRNAPGTGVSRRKILGSVAASAIASTTVVGTASAKEVAEATSVDELSGIERFNAISDVLRREDFQAVERRILDDHDVVRDLGNSTAYKVTESTGDTRHVVTVRYPATGGRNGDSETFIQYTGIDELTNEFSTEALGGVEARNITGVHVSQPDVRIQQESILEIGWSEIEEYVIENGDVHVESAASPDMGQKGEVCSEDVGTQCGGGGGACDTCLTEVATGCSPSLSCIADVAAAFLTTVGACGICITNPEPISRSLSCASCLGAVIGNRDAPSCLGCDDTELTCVPESQDRLC